MDIVLVHPVFKTASKLINFYDGYTVAHNGVVRIPFDGERSIRWAKSCWLKGYNRTEDGQAFPTWTAFEQEVFRSAESAEDTKSLDARRQS
jgi:hypothetical protein